MLVTSISYQRHCDDMTNITDITYGIPAEVWPRDYTNVEKALMFWRKYLIPVRVTMEDGQVFCMFVQGLM